MLVTTELRIADTFTDGLARLSGDEQKSVKTTVFDLHVNPASPGLHYHKLDKAKDKHFWSVRVSSDIRIMVHRTKLGVLERLSFDKQLWLTTHVFLFTTDQVAAVPSDSTRHHHGPVWRPLDQLDDMFWPDQRRLIQAHAALIRRQL